MHCLLNILGNYLKEIIFLVIIWLSRDSSFPVYSVTGSAKPYVTGIAKPVTLLIGDEEPGETQILIILIILSQLQKFIYVGSQPFW